MLITNKHTGFKSVLRTTMYFVVADTMNVPELKQSQNKLLWTTYVIYDIGYEMLFVILLNLNKMQMIFWNALEFIVVVIFEYISSSVINIMFYAAACLKLIIHDKLMQLRVSFLCNSFKMNVGNNKHYYCTMLWNQSWVLPWTQSGGVA